MPSAVVLILSVTSPHDSSHSAAAWRPAIQGIAVGIAEMTPTATFRIGIQNFQFFSPMSFLQLPDRLWQISPDKTPPAPQ